MAIGLITWYALLVSSSFLDGAVRPVALTTRHIDQNIHP